MYVIVIYCICQTTSYIYNFFSYSLYLYGIVLDNRVGRNKPCYLSQKQKFSHKLLKCSILVPFSNNSMGFDSTTFTQKLLSQ